MTMHKNQFTDALEQTVHGTAVIFQGMGILLQGPSQSGKSDLALRLIHEGGALIADDRVILERQDMRVEARPPKKLEGCLEVRGLGIIPVSFQAPYPIHLILELKPYTEIARLPEPQSKILEGIKTPLFHFDPFVISYQSRLCVVLDTVVGKSLSYSPNLSGAIRACGNLIHDKS